MLAQLIVMTGPDKGLSFALVPGRTVHLGRNSETGNRLTDPTVSRSHCKIDFGHDQVFLRNISAKGTYVNGKKVDECRLNPGDVIRLGGTQLNFVVDEPVESEPQPEEPSSLWSTAAAPAIEAVAKLVGQTLGHYAIEKIIAKGSSGILFKALDTEDGKLVALKVMTSEFSRDEEEKQRFIRAMKAMLPVRHPNIVTVYNAGKTESRCWVAMEYVEGESLTRVIEHMGVAGMLDWRFAFRVAMHIGRALEYAHGQLIIHRNVTPAAILWRSGDKVAKLGDLMLAKGMEGKLAEDVSLQGRLVGDVAYMSPERTRCTADVDGRSDLYGLGATLYALVTGRPPFIGKSQIEVIGKIHKAPPELPSALQESRPDNLDKGSTLQYQLLQLEAIPEAFEKMILKLLSKRPVDRYQSAAEVLALLERIGKREGLSV